VGCDLNLKMASGRQPELSQRRAGPSPHDRVLGDFAGWYRNQLVRLYGGTRSRGEGEKRIHWRLPVKQAFLVLGWKFDIRRDKEYTVRKRASRGLLFPSKTGRWWWVAPVNTLHLPPPYPHPSLCKILQILEVYILTTLFIFVLIFCFIKLNSIFNFFELVFGQKFHSTFYRLLQEFDFF